MLNTKKHFNQLDATLAVKELDNETAAAIQGGASLTLYDDADSRLDQTLGSFNFGGKKSLISNDKISTIVINDSTKWRFFLNKDYKGDAKTFGRGTHRLTGTKFNNAISSFVRVA